MARHRSLSDVTAEKAPESPVDARNPDAGAELRAAVLARMGTPETPKRAPARPRLNVDMPADLYDALKADAKARGVSLSELVRTLVALYLGR